MCSVELVSGIETVEIVSESARSIDLSLLPYVFTRGQFMRELRGHRFVLAGL